MAISKYGILGPQNGKVGPVVFYMLNGQNVCRMVGRYIDDPSGNQKVNRSGMSVTMKFNQSMYTFIKSGFELEARGTTKNAFNLAVSYNKKHALTGTYPDIEIDYAKVLLSKGTLPTTSTASVTKVEGGILIEWDPTADSAQKAYSNDMVTIGLHYPGRDGSLTYLNEARRKDGSLFLPISTKNMRNAPLEVYLCFKSADGTRISDSVYVGNLNGKAINRKQRKAYKDTKARLEDLKARFAQEQELMDQLGKKSKAYNNLKKECEVWQSRLDHMPGKPLPKQT